MLYKGLQIETKDYPREMYVWNNNGEPRQRLVMAYIPDLDKFVTMDNTAEIELFTNASDVKKRSIKDGLKVGDVIKSSDGHEMIVIISGIIIVCKHKNCTGYSSYQASGNYLLEELIEDGYTLKHSIEDQTDV